MAITTGRLRRIFGAADEIGLRHTITVERMSSAIDFGIYFAWQSNSTAQCSDRAADGNEGERTIEGFCFVYQSLWV